MPAPTSYADESELAAYMLSVLDWVGTDLQLSATPTALAELGDFTEPINDTLLQYGTDDIASIEGVANIAKLRAMARVHAWKLAQARASALYDFSDGGQSLKRSQIASQIAKQLATAESELATIPGIDSGATVVRIGSVRYRNDPYGPFDPSVPY